MRSRKITRGECACAALALCDHYLLARLELVLWMLQCPLKLFCCCFTRPGLLVEIGAKTCGTIARQAMEVTTASTPVMKVCCKVMMYCAFNHQLSHGCV